MANQTFEEAIRLAFETSGTDGIKQAASIIAGMGDVSEEAKQQAAALLDEIGNVEKTGAAARQYETVGKEVLEYQRQISAARAKVLELAAAVKESDAPTKTQQRELAKARSTLSELVGEQQRELGTLRTLKAGLDAQGISTRSAAAAQTDLAARTAKASANLREMVTDLKRTRDADATLQASLAAAAAKSKAETDQYDAALKKVRAEINANAAAAKRGAADATAGMEATGSAAGRLRGILAGLTAYFSFQAMIGGVKSLLSTGDQFDKFQKQLTNMYGGAAGGEKAFAWVKQFAKDTPLQLDQVMQSFIQLKNFGIDPMSGALQAAVDQNARLGGESERLQRITLAMGQAFAKGALQGQDIKQMIEAGVPVWHLLSEVTGKNTAELQKMSEAGALGTDVMHKFFVQMGTDAAGAATEQMDTLSGQFSNLQDNIQQFQDRVSKKGVLDYLKGQLSSLNDLFAKMAADGRLDAYAKRLSDALISMAQSLKSATLFVVDHASAIKKLVQVYAGLKLARILLEMGAFTGRLVSVMRAAKLTAAAAEGLSVSMAVLRGAVILLSGPIGWIIGALALFAAGTKVAADAIVDYASKHSEAAEQSTKDIAKYKASMLEFAEIYRKRAETLAEYADVQVLAAAQVANLSTAEREAYKRNLEGHDKYVKAREHEAQLMIASGDASDAWIGYQKKMQDEAAKTTAGMKAFADGVKTASEASLAHMSVAAVGIKESLVNASVDSQKALGALQGEFANFGKKTPKQMGDLALAVANLGTQAGQAGEQFRSSVRKQLDEMTSGDLLRFQQAGQSAFTTFNTSAKESASFSEQTLHPALARLGVAVEQWGMKTSDAGQDNIRAFEVVATNAVASAGTIEAAFNKALANATTADDAKAIGAELQKAGAQGKVGFDVTARAVAAVEDRIRALKTFVDPLAADFARLGITSQRALDDAAAAAKHSFDNIVRAAREGKASMNDVRAAFDGYARAQLDSVAHAEVWKREQVRNALETQASVLGVSDELARMGVAGFDAGNKTAQGAHTASAALQGTASAVRDVSAATDEAAASTEKYGESAKKAGGKVASYQSQFNPAAVALNGLSDAMLRAYEATNKFAGTPFWVGKFNEVTAEWQRQNKALSEQLQLLDKQNGAYDEMSKRVESLRAQYGYLNDDQLRSLAQAQQTLENNQKQAAAAARQQHEEAAKAVADEQAALAEKWQKEAAAQKAAAPAAAADGTQRIAVDLNVSASQQPGAVPAQLSPADVQKIANEVVRVIGIARTSSNR